MMPRWKLHSVVQAAFEGVQNQSPPSMNKEYPEHNEPKVDPAEFLFKIHLVSCDRARPTIEKEAVDPALDRVRKLVDTCTGLQRFQTSARF